MNSDQNNFIKSIKRLYLLMNRHIDEKLKAYGLARSQFQVVHFIYKAGSLTQKELQQAMQVEPATLTGIIDVLAKKGLLQKTESKTDKRSSVLQLTQKGKKLREEIPFLYEFIEKKMFQGITVINQKLIREFVNQMIQNLEWEIKGN